MNPEKSGESSSGFIVGIDEAGYGPLLGPYVIAAAAFHYRGKRPVESVSPAFWSSLGRAVSVSPDKNRVAVADSKVLYRRTKGLRYLEEGVLAFLQARGAEPDSLRRLLVDLGEDPAELDRYPWYRDKDLPLPYATYRPVIASFAQKLKQSFSRSAFSFLGIRAVVLRAGSFNDRLEAVGNKAAVALEALAGLLRQLFVSSRSQPCVVTVDRQGGRVHYARFLFSAVKPKAITIMAESPKESVYRAVGRRGENLVVRFCTEGEQSSLPVALASMTAKYVRELHMELLNRYFRDSLGPSLKPTAGYVKDARRFLADIAPYIKSAPVPLELLVRHR